VFFEYDGEEVGQSGAHDQSLRESRGLIEFVLEEHHEYEYLEDAHGVAGNVAEGSGNPGADVDGDGVGGKGEDVVVLADGVDAVEERLAVRVRQAPLLQHIAL
jgi:hypothetical protein